jgi:hypothetical protein
VVNWAIIRPAVAVVLGAGYVVVSALRDNVEGDLVDEDTRECHRTRRCRLHCYERP